MFALRPLIKRRLTIAKSLLFAKAHFSCTKAYVARAAPDFSGKAWTKDGFKTISLKDYFGKYLVLFFYPLDFTFVCPTEIIDYSNKAKDFRKTG